MNFFYIYKKKNVPRTYNSLNFSLPLTYTCIQCYVEGWGGGKMVIVKLQILNNFFFLFMGRSGNK